MQPDKTPARPWLTSPILGVANVRRAAEYYRDILGFELDPDEGIVSFPGAEDGVYAIVKRSGAWIHFQIRRNAAVASTRSPIERDVYVYVYDVRALHAEYAARGARILSPPQPTNYGILEMVIEDPDGYRIAFGEIMQRA